MILILNIKINIKSMRVTKYNCVNSTYDA